MANESKSSTKTLKLKRVKAGITPAQEKQDQATKEVIKKKITAEKDLMYVYPADCDDLPARKKFRRNARNAKASYMKQLRNAKPEDKAKILKEATAWASKVYTKTHQPSF